MQIYRAIFPNGKSYIGQTSNFKYRQHQHYLVSNRIKFKLENNIPLSKSEKENKNTPTKIFYHAIIKYGWDNIKWEILEEVDTRQELNQREQYWIRYYRTYIGFDNSQGYNANLGGAQYDKFSTLNDVQLKQYGEDYRAGMNQIDLQKKYNLPQKENHAYFTGKRLSEFTGITEDISLPHSKNLTTKILKEIIEDFKKTGSCVETGENFNLKKADIYYIVTGRKYSEYSGASIDFFKQYRRIGIEHDKIDVDKILDMREDGYTVKEISQEISHLPFKYIQDIYYGRLLSNYSGIKPSKREERKYTNPVNSTFTMEQILNIIKLNDEGMNYSEIASIYNRSPNVINNICKGVTWSYVTGRKYNSETKTYDIIDIKNP